MGEPSGERLPRPGGTIGPVSDAALSREEILEYACGVAANQLGGTLATTHAEDGTPYPTFVLFHLRSDGTLLFGSGAGPQHTRNIVSTPEVAFLIDNREVIRTEWTAFDRIIVEGSARRIAPEDAAYAGYLDELREKNAMAGFFTERGQLFAITPRRLILHRGFEQTRHTIDFEGD